MWLILLPLPWLLAGFFAARLQRGRGSGCFAVGGVFIWPQARLLEHLGISPWMAWLASAGLMVVFALLGYLLGLRLFGPPKESEPHGP
jgi:hypothetical protein